MDARPLEADNLTGWEAEASGIKQRDPSAIDGFVKEKAPRLLAYYLLSGMRFRDAEELASDCLEDIVMTLIEHPLAYVKRANGSFRAWCFTVARNRLRDWLRKRPRVLLTRPELVEARPGDDGEQSGDGMQDPAVSQALASALSKLTPGQRDLVASHFGGGLTYREIAGGLGISEDSVKMRAYRAIRKLRSSLQRNVRVKQWLAQHPPLPHALEHVRG